MTFVVPLHDRGLHRRLAKLINPATGSSRTVPACGLARVRVELLGPHVFDKR